MSTLTPNLNVKEDVQTWKYKNECSPFKDLDNYYIVVDSEYLTPGNDPDGRLGETQLYAVTKLLEFYGKDLSEIDDVIKVSTVENYLVSSGAATPMKVLVSVPISDFDLVNDDPSACEINRPENPIEVVYDIDKISSKIGLVTSALKKILERVQFNSKFVVNLNLPKEIARLSAMRLAIQEYLNYNNISAASVEDPNCVLPNIISKQMTLGFDHCYKCQYVLIDGNQHTIGYNCFLKKLDNITTTFFLINLNSMVDEFMLSDRDDFNDMDYLKNFLKPTPVISDKQNLEDGLEVYDEDGNYNPPDPTADTTRSSAKTDAELSRETSEINSTTIKKRRAENARQTTEYVGDINTSPSAIKEITNNVSAISTDSTPNIDTTENSNDVLTPQQSAENKDLKDKLYEHMQMLYHDIIAKIDFNVLQKQVLPVMLENFVCKYGKEAFEDPDLQAVFGLQDYISEARKIEQEEEGDFSKDIGLPKLQQIQVPNYFENKEDFLKPAMDELLFKLMNTFLKASVSLILDTFDNYLDFVLSKPLCGEFLGEVIFDQKYKDWLATTYGLSNGAADDDEVFSSIITTQGGLTFAGVISNIINKACFPPRSESFDIELHEEPIQGGFLVYVEDLVYGRALPRYISPQDLKRITSEISQAVDELNAVLSPDEFKSLLKGTSSNYVSNLATVILTRGIFGRSSNIVFYTEQDVVDVFAVLGRMVAPVYLSEQYNNNRQPYSPEILPDSEEALFLVRQNYLKTQDPSLSDKDAYALILRQKKRAKDRILKAYNALQDFSKGKFMPLVSYVFGPGGLIEELPPVVEEVSKITTEATIDPIIDLFSQEVAPSDETKSYARIWNLQLASDYYLGNSMSIYNSFLLDVKNDVYTFGYEPSQTISNIKEPAVKNAIKSFDFEFGKYFDFLNREGDTERLFDQMVSELGLTSSNKTYKWYVNNIVTFIQDNDNVMGSKNSGVAEEWTDPNNKSVSYEVRIFESEGSLTVTRYEKEESKEVQIERGSGWTDDIVVLEVNTNTGRKEIDYKSDDYDISNSLATLGQKQTTGKLKTRGFSSGLELVDLSEVASAGAASLANLEIQAMSGETFGSEIKIKRTNSNIIDQFINYISEQKYSNSTIDSTTNQQITAFNSLDLSYPNSDIYGVSELKDNISESMTKLLNASLAGQHCDNLSEIRRVTATSSMQLLIRSYIIEHSLITIQVLDSFDLAFMEDSMFVNSIYSLLKMELLNYQNSFDNLETSLLNEVKDAAIKHYEILNASDSDIEIPEDGKSAVRQLILDEIKILKNPISNALNLQWNYNSWDNFLVEVVFGEYDNIEDSEDDDTTIVNVDKKPSYIFVKEYTYDFNDKKHIYSYCIYYVSTIEIIPTEDFSSDARDSIMTSKKLSSTKILSTQCSRKTKAEDVDDVYDRLKNLMFNTKEYDTLFNTISPIKSFISSIALYQYSALSDPSTFGINYLSNTEGPPHTLFTLMSRVKLTTLQSFTTSIYGGGKVNYQDPFLEKAERN